MINSNTNSAAEGGAELGGLDLGESETTAVSDLTSVPSGARRDNRSELLDGPGEHLAALLLSALHSSQLLGGLVEMNSDTRLPVFAEMYVWDDVVVLYHC